MVEIRTQNPYEIDLPFDVKEGKYTVQEGVIEGSGNTDVGYFASPVHKGDFVKLETGADWLVSVAGENDTIIGEVLDHPQFYGDRPQATANDGSYTRRKATIRLWGDYVKALKLVDDNSAVTVGNAIAYAGSNEFDKGDSGDAIALESAKANSGKKIAVLLGYRGL